MKIKYEKGTLGRLAQGDLVWLDPNPIAGREQGDYRPHLVISKEMTNLSNIVTLLPLTRTERNLPFRYPVELADAKSWVVVDQPRSFDLKEREYQLDEEQFLSKKELGEILGIFKAIFF